MMPNYHVQQNRNSQQNLSLPPYIPSLRTLDQTLDTIVIMDSEDFTIQEQVYQHASEKTEAFAHNSSQVFNQLAEKICKMRHSKTEISKSGNYKVKKAFYQNVLEFLALARTRQKTAHEQLSSIQSLLIPYPYISKFLQLEETAMSAYNQVRIASREIFSQLRKVALQLEQQLSNNPSIQPVKFVFNIGSNKLSLCIGEQRGSVVWSNKSGRALSKSFKRDSKLKEVIAQHLRSVDVIEPNQILTRIAWHTIEKLQLS